MFAQCFIVYDLTDFLDHFPFPEPLLDSNADLDPDTEPDPDPDPDPDPSPDPASRIGDDSMYTTIPTVT